MYFLDRLRRKYSQFDRNCKLLSTSFGYSFLPFLTTIVIVELNEYGLINSSYMIILFLNISGFIAMVYTVNEYENEIAEHKHWVRNYKSWKKNHIKKDRILKNLLYFNIFNDLNDSVIIEEYDITYYLTIENIEDLVEYLAGKYEPNYLPDAPVSEWYDQLNEYKKSSINLNDDSF